MVWVPSRYTASMLCSEGRGSATAVSTLGLRMVSMYGWTSREKLRVCFFSIAPNSANKWQNYAQEVRKQKSRPLLFCNWFLHTVHFTLEIVLSKLSGLLVPLFAEFCVLLLSRSGAMMLSATVFRRRGLGFSGLLLFSSRVRVRGSFTIKDKRSQYETQ